MLYKNLKMSIRKIKDWSVNDWSVNDWIASIALVFAILMVLFHFYQVNRDLPYIETLQVTDPVEIDRDQYDIGDTITGFFEGERFSDLPVIFNRTLVCDDFRAILKPIRVESPPVGPLNRNTPIITLTDDIFLVGQPLAPQTSCEIIYSPQTVVEKYLLGGEKLQSDQSFRTTTFDIVE